MSPVQSLYIIYVAWGFSAMQPKIALVSHTWPLLKGLDRTKNQKYILLRQKRILTLIKSNMLINYKLKLKQ